jgi:hypothetical protein
MKLSAESTVLSASLALITLLTSRFGHLLERRGGVGEGVAGGHIHGIGLVRIQGDVAAADGIICRGVRP